MQTCELACLLHIEVRYLTRAYAHLGRYFLPQRCHGKQDFRIFSAYNNNKVRAQLQLTRMLEQTPFVRVEREIARHFHPGKLYWYVWSNY